MTIAPQRTDVESLPAIDEYLLEVFSEAWSGEFAPTLSRLFASPADLMSAEDGSVVAFRNRDIRALASDPKVGNQPASGISAPFNAVSNGGKSGFELFMGNHIFTTNPPLHRPLRRVFARHFTRGKVTVYEELARATVDRVLADLAERGSIDCQHDLASPVAAHFWTGLIGLTPEEGALAASLVSGLSPSLLLSLSDEEARAVNTASGVYMEEVSAAVMRRLASGESRLLSEMAADLEQIELPGCPENVGMMLSAVLFDGFDTLSRSLSNLVYALLNSGTSSLTAIREDPSLIAAAYLEGIRLHPPLYMTQRIALEDVTYGSTLIAAGTPITMCWLFGNRDPEAFDAPEDFLFDRSIMAQTTFGGGFHICPGRSIAKVLGEALIRGLAGGSFEVSIAGDVRWEPNSIAHTLQSLPMVVSER